MLDLRYGEDVPAAVAAFVEHHGRAAGLALAELELVGSDLGTAEAFIVAAESGDAQLFVAALKEGVVWRPVEILPGLVPA